jgi:hypothetical protein
MNSETEIDLQAFTHIGIIFVLLIIAFVLWNFRKSILSGQGAKLLKDMLNDNPKKLALILVLPFLILLFAVFAPLCSNIS